MRWVSSASVVRLSLLVLLPLPVLLPGAGQVIVQLGLLVLPEALASEAGETRHTMVGPSKGSRPVLTLLQQLRAAELDVAMPLLAGPAEPAPRAVSHQSFRLAHCFEVLALARGFRLYCFPLSCGFQV